MIKKKGMTKIIWTIEAKKTYYQNTKHLIENWNKTVMINFREEVFKTLKLLKTNNKIGVFEQKTKAYKIVVVPQISLYYNINNEDIILLSFWNNKQSDKNKMFLK